MEEIAELLHNDILLAVISGIGASLITFVLSILLTLCQSRKALKISLRSFTTIESLILNYDAEPLSNMESIKIYPTKDYYTFYTRINSQQGNAKCRFAQLLNLGENPILEVNACLRILLIGDKSEEDGWMIDIKIPIIDKQSRVLIPLHKEGVKTDNRYIASAEITYRTLANEKMKMVYIIDSSRIEDSLKGNQLPDLTISYYRKFFLFYIKILKSKTSSMSWITFYNPKQ